MTNSNSNACSVNGGRIHAAFKRGISLICYAAPGDPLFGKQSLQVYSDCGVNIVEIGLPSENPYADGPTVASSMKRSIESGMDARAVMHGIAELELDFPSLAKIWMCYENTDLTSLGSLLSTSSVDGLLMVGFDPVGVHSQIYRTLVRRGKCSIGFVEFDIFPETIARARYASGYIMLQARRGVTGASGQAVDKTLARRIALIRDAGIEHPIAVGFGLSNPEHVREAIGFGADGVIIGSACLEKAQQGPAELARFLTALRRAADFREM